LVVVTGALAIFTAAMAWFTRRAVEAGERTAKAAEDDIRQGAELVHIGQDQVRETQRQADLALSALEAERQPVIVPTTTTREPWDPRRQDIVHHFYRLQSNPVEDSPLGRPWASPCALVVNLVVR
jgi:hypothetical protein